MSAFPKQLADIAGYELVPTSTAPYYSVVMPNADESPATELLAHFGPMTMNSGEHISCLPDNRGSLLPSRQ